MPLPVSYYVSPEQASALAAACVGIAGAGGLGSNSAVMLARSGVGRLIVIDGDVVEERNLNRQHYFPRHIGMNKVEALAAQIAELAPQTSVEALPFWLDEGNIPSILDKAPIWIEAFDNARAKALFATMALKAGKAVVSGSGMAGIGRGIMKRRVLRTSGGTLLAAVGDFASDIAGAPPLAPRVMQCAAMQADAALEWILTGNIKTFD